VLETLPGIGPHTARTLLKAFGSVQRVMKAGPEEIANVRGFTLEKALS
jgi:excinuclease UvrABC nuclease subunit